MVDLDCYTLILILFIVSAFSFTRRHHFRGRDMLAPRASVPRLVRNGTARGRALVTRTARPCVVTLAAGDVPKASSSGKGRVLVLGGTGFVGQQICKEALDVGYDVTSVSRRGTPPDQGASTSTLQSVDWRVGDATDPNTAIDILSESDFVGCIHAVGMLLANDFNAFASGSGSVPDKNATYDLVTRVTALNAADATVTCLSGSDAPPPFVFVSAAEARWDFKAPVDWLEDYLIAKRAVEERLTELNSQGKLRASWLRPSLVYTFDKPAALPAVAAFTFGNLIGIPFVDKPVTVDTLAKAAVTALSDGTTSGVLDYREMERLSAL